MAFLEVFWDLATPEPSKRASAAGSLTTHLQADSSRTAYALKRLCSGLCSPRPGARQGFASALTTVLSARLAGDDGSLLSLRDVVCALREATTPSGRSGTRAAELRELHLGRLLGVLAVARSGRISRDLTELSDDDDETEVHTLELAQMAAEIMRRRRWLREVAVCALVELFDQVPSESRTFASLMSADVLGPLFSNDRESEGDGTVKTSITRVSELDAEQLALALAVQRQLARRATQGAVRAALDESLPTLLTRSRLVPLVEDAAGAREKSLKSNPSLSLQAMVEPLKLSSHTFPEVHVVWSELMDACGVDLHATFGPSATSSPNIPLLRELWNTTVDGALLVPGATHERRGIALVLAFTRVAPILPPDAVAIVLSRPTLRCAMNALSQNNRTIASDQGNFNYLSQLARDSLSRLASTHSDNAAEGAAAWRLATATALMSNGDLHFDARTGTRTVETLLRGLVDDSETSNRYVDFLEEQIFDASSLSSSPGRGDDDAEDAATMRQLWAVDALYAISKHATASFSPQGNSAAADRVSCRALLMLMSVAFFKLPAKEKDSSETKPTPKKRGSKESKATSGDSVASTSSAGRDVTTILSDALSRLVFHGTDGLPTTVVFAAASRFFSVVADITAGPFKLDLADASCSLPPPLLWLSRATGCWEVLTARGTQLRQPLPPAVDAARLDAISRCDTIMTQLAKGTDTDESRAACALSGLLLVTSLRLLRTTRASTTEEDDADDDDTTTCSLLVDLVQCCDQLHLPPFKGARHQKAQPAQARPDLSSLAQACITLVSNENADTALSVLASTSKGSGMSAAATALILQPHTRGTREVVRRAWGMLCSCSASQMPIGETTVPLLVSVVCGDEGTFEDQDEDDDENNSSDDESDGSTDDGSDRMTPDAERDEGDEDEGDASDNDSEGVAQSDEDEADDDEEDQDIVLNDEALAGFLGSDENGDSSLGVAMRQRHRKSGLLSAERRVLGWRLRVLDLLDALARGRAVASHDDCALVATQLLVAAPKLLRAARRLATAASASRRGSRLKEAGDLARRICSLRWLTRPHTAAVHMVDEGLTDRLAETTQRLLEESRVVGTSRVHASLAATCVAACLRSLHMAVMKGTERSDAYSEMRSLAWTRTCAAVADVLEDSLTRRSRRLSNPLFLFQELVARAPSASLAALLYAPEGGSPALPRAASSAASPFMCATAFELLGRLYCVNSRTAVVDLGVLKQHACAALNELSVTLARSPIADRSAIAPDDSAAVASPQGQGQVELVKARRIKPLLQCAGSLVSAIQSHKWDDAAQAMEARLIPALRLVLESACGPNRSSAVREQCTRLINAIIGTAVTDGEESESNTKAIHDGRKRKLDASESKTGPLFGKSISMNAKRQKRRRAKQKHRTKK